MIFLKIFFKIFPDTDVCFSCTVSIAKISENVRAFGQIIEEILFLDRLLQGQ